MIDKILSLIRKKRDEKTEFDRLISTKPRSIRWVTKPKQKWYVAYNPTSSKITTSDVFGSELVVYNYPIGLTEMSIPKYFVPSPLLIRMFYSLEWTGGDLRPERKYRALKRPGVVEVLY